MASNQSFSCAYNFTLVLEPNSTYLRHLLGVPDLRIASNPDIGGIGVIIAFVATAYVTLFLVVLYYMSSCLSSVDPSACNRMDLGIIQRTKMMPFIRILNRQTLDWEPRIRKAILMYSDQQLITGLALLISVFTQLHTHVTLYHWQIAVYLAWFSSLTHLCTLSILRQSFQENKRIRNLRLPLMAINVTLLISALIPTGFSTLLSAKKTSALQARCFFKPSQSIFFDPTTRGLSFLFSVTILLLSSISRAIRLSPKASQIAWRSLVERPSHVLRKLLWRSFAKVQSNKVKTWVYKTVYCFLGISSLFLKCLFELYTSMLWEILWLAFALIWGTLRLILLREGYPSDTRYYTEKEVYLPQDENQWTFGQVIAIFLLTLPWLSLIQDFLAPEATIGNITTDAASEPCAHATATGVSRMIRLGSKGFHRRVEVGEVNTSQDEQSGDPLTQNPVERTTGSLNQDPVPTGESPFGRDLVQHRKNAILFLNRDPYLYEWFRLSIVMANLYALSIFGFLLVYSSIIGFNLDSIYSSVLFAAILISSLLLWMLCFVATDVARFSEQPHPVEIANPTGRRSAAVKRSILYACFLLLLQGGWAAAIYLFFYVQFFQYKVPIQVYPEFG